MKYALAILPFVLLAGCCNNPPMREKFPDPPLDIIEKCPDLATVDTGANTKMSDILSVVSLNYSRYYVCAAAVDAWQSWYEAQQANFNKLHAPK